jgi:hypothetical protein
LRAEGYAETNNAGGGEQRLEVDVEERKYLQERRMAAIVRSWEARWLLAT